MELKDYRAAIDDIDRELLALFARRLALCGEIAVRACDRAVPRKRGASAVRRRKRKLKNP